MNEFLKSTRFKILVAVFVLLFSFMLHAATDGTAAPFMNKVIGVLITPLQSLSTSIADGVGGFFDTFLHAGRIAEENTTLEDEVRRLRDQLVDYEVMKQENDFLKEFLDIKEQSADLEMVPAKVVGREAVSRFYSFTIDRGSTSGISYRDPVISADGLVGIVSEVGPGYAKVTTILDTTLDVGCIDIAVRETGVTTGTVELAEQGLLKLAYLPRDSLSAPGDIVMTTGVGGFFPGDIRVGSILEVHPEEHGLSLYAIVEPAADIRHVKDVMVITDYRGKLEGDAATELVPSLPAEDQAETDPDTDTNPENPEE